MSDTDQNRTQSPSEGAYQSELRQRRDIVAANIKTIGWSWAVLADRTAIPYSKVLSFKALKGDFPDAYVLWTTDLAKAVAAIPRPAPDAVQGREIEPAVQHVRVADGTAAAPAIAAATARAEDLMEAQRRATVDAIVGRYIEAANAPDLTDEQKDAVRGALSNVLGDLGLVELAQAALRAREAEAPPRAPIGLIGGAAARVPMNAH